MNRIRALRLVATGIVGLLCAKGSAGQEANPTPPPGQQQAPPATNSAAAAPLQLTLQDALERARKNSTQFQAALTAAGLARQDRIQARNALLPTVTYNNSAIYTKGVPLGTEPFIGAPVIFIANNAVHEYLSQAHVHQAFDAAAVANFPRLGPATPVSPAPSPPASPASVLALLN